MKNIHIKNLTVHHTHLRAMRGVGMLEVLVALVVLSIGLLGTATLYVTALKAKTAAISRMQAINLAADLADRIRANRTAGDAYKLGKTDSVKTPKDCVDTTSGPATTCSAAELAQFDLYQWTRMADDTLPGVVEHAVTVTPVASAPTLYTIEVDWSEPATGESLKHLLQIQI